MRSARPSLAPRGLSLALATSCLALGLLLGGCKDRNATGELSSPKDATEFESKHRKAFDDDYTHQNVELMGRAPNDVLDQQLFAERLGFADVLLQVRVAQVFGKGRYEGRKEQYIAVAIEEVVMGTLPDGTEEDQLLVVKGDADLPGDLNDATLLLFVKWAPGEVPSYHHHLMPADETLLEMIGAMVKHAQEKGVLNADAEVSKGRKARKSRRKNKETGDPSEDDPPPN